ncbi:hypothetical protein sscle_02g021120 [Sclerotinia sclerotiorum 1980 UF-70]|uniref:Uncharacterized protein n=1 Tax=Sclerotinia sclerotiorum (strain ATCC 18683 / 1980 / Ss-1) TaxID=665079 RepID=A0A1D9PXR2_SCLS1|nr:hypothetical protein sscle_02g021120 [Sclerotinia sclerotiorum 1980 UF-70]
MANTPKKHRFCDDAPENINLQKFLDCEINIQKLNGDGPLASKDADATKENITGICRKWKRFCEFRNEQYWRAAIQKCNKGTTMMFLRYICENYRIRTFSSVHQYLLQFKQLYNRVNGRHMDTNDAKEVLKYLDTILTKEFTLRREKTAKPVLGADDLILLLTHHWARDTSIFPTEDQRLALATIMLLLIYTGCRPAELVDAAKGKIAIGRDQTYEDDNWDNECEGLDETKDDDPIYENPEPWVDPKISDYDDKDDEDILTREYKAFCYEDIRLWIVRNPTPGERDLLGMEITLAHHKGANRNPKPTTFLFHEEALPILCPVSHILAIAIRDNAIKVDGFTHAKPFFTSNLQDPTKAVLVHWKPEKLKVPIFRQAVWTFDGLSTSEHKALRYSTFAYYLDRLGWAAGFAQKLTSYCFRRGTGNAVDGAATTAVRDQVMRHNPQTGVFCGSYINEKVRFIVQDAVLDQPTNIGFLRAFTHMSLTCDPRAPIDVPEEILKALPPDPEIMELKREREEYKRQYRSYNRAPPEIRKECEQLRRQIDSLQKQRDRAIKIEFRRDYFDRIHDEELERQLKKVPTNEYVEPVVHHQLPERTRLQEVLCDLSRDMSPSDIVSRRIRTIDLMVALSYRQEQEVQHSNHSSRESSEFSEKQPLCKDPFPLLSKASTLTNTLLSTVRLQHHLGARVIISTQEPTISPSLLDLSSIVIVHRFTSPEWLNSLKRHLAGATSNLLDDDNTDSDGLASSRGNGDNAKRLFAEIVKLNIGEALLFSPSAMIDVEVGSNGKVVVGRLGDGFLKIRVRIRLTADGDKSIVAA